MSTIDDHHPTASAVADDHYHASALRILRAIAEVDPARAGARLILPDGRTVDLEALGTRLGRSA
jgi:hypothetical protein